jgi:hypothetical protein
MTIREGDTAQDEPANYVVRIQDRYGRKVFKCDTEAEAWKALGNMAFGGLYSVGSETGKSTSDFVPF